MPIGCMQIFFGKGFLCFPKCNQFTMKEEDLVEISWDLAEVVMDDQNGLAFLFQGLRVCMMMSSLTESILQKGSSKKDIRFLDQAAGDQHPLELPS